ncbi:response regulator [Deefgea piscis]|uniref:Response regulator n=1 Tax=Deefgea piscis TaxID=2739061 RepID=A0A6M8SXY6_9NEIS|nr:response regulator [Deefgea piscis]QKJ66597.1 response regulator [Deefgea piscis]
MSKVRPYSFTQRAAIDEPVATSGVRDFSQYKILVIDHVSAMRMTLGMMLGQFGAKEIEYASRSDEALAQMRGCAYDIILCAYDLGHGFDGLYVFEAARRYGALKASSVFILLTAERQSGKVIGAAELAPDAILLKPFTGEVLYARIERALHKKSPFQPIDAAYIANDFLRAIQLCEFASKENPAQAIDFLRMKVHLLLRIGDWKTVRDLARTELVEHDWPWLKMALGKALLQLKEYTEAQQIFQQLINQYPLILAAYDGLAQTFSATHDLAAAKQTLQAACERSPMLARRRELGEVAIAAEDWPLAETALSDSIRMARFSFVPQVSDYAALAEVQLRRGDVAAARQTAGQIRQDFPRSDDRILADVLESNVALKLGETSKARTLLDTALKAASSAPSATLGLALAQSCLGLNRMAEAQTLTRAVLQNRHDDPKLAAQVARVFKSQGQEAEALRLIEATAADIVQLNNEAVALAQAGDLTAAAERFLAALQDMPNNLQILLNTVNALLALVNQLGGHAGYLQQAGELLIRVQALDPTSGRALQLAEIYRKTQRRFALSST